jgi:Ni,Fe-hydrogenase maturation factor
VAGRELVIVVDASVDVVAVTVSDVEARQRVGALSHHLDVSTLIGLAELVGTPPGRVVTVAVPVRTLALGTELHWATAREVSVATERVLALVSDERSPVP